MTSKTTEKLYEFHVKNLRAVTDGLDHVERAARAEIARGRNEAGQTFVRIYALLLGAWSECRLYKALHERDAFGPTDRSKIMSDESAFSRWVKTVETAFVKRYPGVRPRTAELRLKEINETLTSELKPIIELRNKMAHGQWIVPLNRKLDNVDQDQADALRNENLLSLKFKRAMVEALCACIHDLAVSTAAFEKNFDRHFMVLSQARTNLATRSYDSWRKQLQEKFQRGLAARTEGIK